MKEKRDKAVGVVRLMRRRFRRSSRMQKDQKVEQDAKGSEG